MAKRPLKVFRTPIGFHDAYVAATSRKEALKAWGASTDLFSSGAAQVVTDPELIRKPLEQPGVVIRVARGTAAEHIAAAGKLRTPKGYSLPAGANAPSTTKPRKKQPKPSRARLGKAEAALEEKSASFAAALAGLDAKIEALRRERDELRAKRDEEMRELEQRRRTEEDTYRTAVDRWEG